MQISSIRVFITVVALLTATALDAQEDPGTEVFPVKEWHHMNLEQDGYPGISTELAHALAGDRESKPVIVAIIDSGMDTTHEDLKEQLWINEDEIPGNDIDDDNNGYVDDVHGWNFIGGAKGNIEGETLELTRLYSRYRKQFDGMDTASAALHHPDEWARYITVREDFMERSGSARSELKLLNTINTMYERHLESVGKALGPDYSSQDLMELAQSSDKGQESAQYLLWMEMQGLGQDVITEYMKHLESQYRFHLNPDADTIRAYYVGDDPDDWNDTLYGNNDLMGQSSSHGTHVAGIIGATRDNGLGTNGVTSNVRFMALRVVPDGDERDKDIALAIKYAVRNGASIINMSFGKDYSPDYEKIHEVARWAGDQNVLLVHAAGNESLNLDESNNFPYPPDDLSPTWIEVGSSTYDTAALASEFSNYGKNRVDLFAPGDVIYSTVPQSKYRDNSGTSMAAPMVSGVAALIKSYFPEITAAEIKNILIESGDDYGDLLTPIPGTDETIEFRRLSRSGVVLNAHRAFIKAMEHSN